MFAAVRWLASTSDGRRQWLLGALAGGLPFFWWSPQAWLAGMAADATAALLPDLDHPGSTLGRWLPWPAVRHGSYRLPSGVQAWYRVGRRRPGGVIWHRGEFHSIGAALIAAGLMAGATLFIWRSNPSFALAYTPVVFGAAALGYLSHLALDLLTPSPQMLLWPLSRRYLRPGWLPTIRVEAIPGASLILNLVLLLAVFAACNTALAATGVFNTQGPPS